MVGIGELGVGIETKPAMHGLGGLARFVNGDSNGAGSIRACDLDITQFEPGAAIGGDVDLLWGFLADCKVKLAIRIAGFDLDIVGPRKP